MKEEFKTLVGADESVNIALILKTLTRRLRVSDLTHVISTCERCSSRETFLTPNKQL